MTIHARPARSLLATATVLLLGLAVAAPVFAQDSDVGDDLDDTRRTTTGTGTAAAAAERARAKREAARQAATAQPERYPQATRKVEQGAVNAKTSKRMQALVALYDGQKYAEAIAEAEAIDADPSYTPYVKSFALQLAANAAMDQGEDDKGIALYQRSLDRNGLSNNDHYRIMYNLAINQIQAQKYPDALATMERFLAETKADGEQELSAYATLLVLAERPAEAVKIYEQLLAKGNAGKEVYLRAMQAYNDIDQKEKGLALLEQARARNLLTEGSDYRRLFLGYVTAGETDKAVAALDEGLAKGLLTAGDGLSKDYSYAAQEYYAAERIEQTIATYRKAANMATDGEAALNLAKVLFNEGKNAEAKAAAQEALRKGVKKPEDANRIIAQAGK
jgi:tetratricopeptide (TPR) repeat protein